MTSPKCENCFHFECAKYRDEASQIGFARCRKASEALPYCTTQRLHLARTPSDYDADPDLYNCGTEGTWFEPLLEVANV